MLAQQIAVNPSRKTDKNNKSKQNK